MRFLKYNNPPTFKSLRGNKINGKNIRLREKKFSDVRNDYNWQSDAVLSRFDAVPVLTLPFAVYVLDYTAEIKRPRGNRFPLAIETLDGKHIGNCTCYEIDEKEREAQLGIMIGDPAYRDKGYGQDVVNTLIDHVFRTTNLKRIYLKTLDWNLRAQKCFMKCGFKPYGQMSRDGNSFVLMELSRDQWQKMRGEVLSNV